MGPPYRAGGWPDRKQDQGQDPARWAVQLASVQVSSVQVSGVQVRHPGCPGLPVGISVPACFRAHGPQSPAVPEPRGLASTSVPPRTRRPGRTEEPALQEAGLLEPAQRGRGSGPGPQTPARWGLSLGPGGPSVLSLGESCPSAVIWGGRPWLQRRRRRSPLCGRISGKICFHPLGCFWESRFFFTTQNRTQCFPFLDIRTHH